MENLPIDAISLPSRIFHSETEDKVYVGEPGNYKEIGGDITLDDLITPTANEFLVGNSAGTEWEKRGLGGSDFGNLTNSRTVPIWNSDINNWTSGGIFVGTAAVNQTIPFRQTNGRLPGIGDAVNPTDAVPLGQLEGMLTADNIDYDNTASGLLAETVQEAVDEIVENISKAGFVQRTGTAIAFDKWATYGAYASPVSGNLSYSFTNMVKGMIQVMYHEDTVAPTLTDTGVTVIETGDYVVENINKITVHCIDENVVEVNIKAL